MNFCCMMGRLTRDPEKRGSDERPFAKFSLAVDRRFKREGQPEADFFDCVAFGKIGNVIVERCHKGTKLLINGEVQNNDYTDRNGNKVHGTSIVVDKFEFAESKKFQESNSQPERKQPKPVAKADDDMFVELPPAELEELPFE